jgi:hypothetical protein
MSQGRASSAIERLAAVAILAPMAIPPGDWWVKPPRTPGQTVLALSFMPLLWVLFFAILAPHTATTLTI